MIANGVYELTACTKGPTKGLFEYITTILHCIF